MVKSSDPLFIMVEDLLHHERQLSALMAGREKENFPQFIKDMTRTAAGISAINFGLQAYVNKVRADEFVQSVTAPSPVSDSKDEH